MDNPNPALAAIQYALDNPNEDPMLFLHYWMYGNFDILRNEWPNVPDSVFIGADSTFEQTGETE